MSKKRVDIRLCVEAKKDIGKKFPGGPTLKGITLSREQYLHFRSITIPRIDEYFNITIGERESFIDSYWLLNKLETLLDEFTDEED